MGTPVVLPNGQKLETAELYCLVTQFLEQSPCRRAAEVLKEELSSLKLLPGRRNWLGEQQPVSYSQAASEAGRTANLQQLCEKLLSLLQCHGYLPVPGLCSLRGSSVTSAVCGQNVSLYSILRTGLQQMRLGSNLTTSAYHLHSARQIFSGFPEATLRREQLSNSFKLHRSVLGHLASVFCVVFDFTGQCIITGADDALVKVWCSRSGQLLATLRGHAAEITDISLSWDNTYLATGSLDKTVRVWCMQSCAPVAVLCGHTSHITSVQFSPAPHEEYRYLASTGKDGFLCFWELDPVTATFSSSPVKFMEKNKMGDHTLCSAFSPGGKHFVTGGTDKLVRIYQCIPGPPTMLAELPGHTDRIMTAQFSLTGNSQFATGSCDGTTRVWSNMPGGWVSAVLTVAADETKKARSLPNTDKVQVTMVGWEKSGTFLVSAHTPDCMLYVWRASTAQLIHRLEGHTGEVFVLEAHPHDCRLLLSAAHDGSIMLWDIVGGRHLQTIQMEYAEDGVPCIFDCKFSPDGTSCALGDSCGYLTICGTGSSASYEQCPQEQFFHTDYHPLMRDRNHIVVDERSQVPPHLLPPPYLVDIDGHPHPARYQEAILKQLRPVQASSHTSVAKEIEEYDEYMTRLHPSFPSGRQVANGISLRHREEGGREGGQPSSSLGGVVPGVSGSAGGGEPQVNVTEGEPQQNMNMLHSLVYSVGMSDKETMVAISLWHNRVVVPLLDPARLKSELLRRRALYEQEEQLFQHISSFVQQQTVAAVVIDADISPRGRELRSGRTIPESPEPLPPSPSTEHSEPSAEESDAWVGEDGEEEDEEEEGLGLRGYDAGSTASSDISDWTTEAGISEINPVRRKTRRSRRDTAAHRSETNRTIAATSPSPSRTEETPPPPPPVKKRPLAKKAVAYSAYWPPEWLKMTSPQPTPYFPQVGDKVMYCWQGHERYLNAVVEQKLYPCKMEQMPWQKYKLSPHEICLVKNVRFVTGPPTLCCITLVPLSPSVPNTDGPSTSAQACKRATFTFKYHDMDGVLDFMLLEHTFVASLQHQWKVGSQFSSFIEGSRWKGCVLSQEPFSADVPQSYWQCYKVQWEDGASDLLSPWDMEPTDSDTDGPRVEDIDVTEEWGGAGEVERILQGLDAVCTMEEAAMFVNPVDFEEEPMYCVAVPFPTDLTTIRARLGNGFYRRKIALKWEVLQLGRNAQLYNEQDSLIVKHGKIVVNTLWRFISTPTCNNPLECHEPEEALNVEFEADVAAGDLGLLPNEDGDMVEDQLQSMEADTVPDLGSSSQHAANGEEKIGGAGKREENGDREEEEDDGGDEEEEEEDEEEEEYKGEEEDEEDEEEEDEEEEEDGAGEQHAKTWWIAGAKKLLRQLRDNEHSTPFIRPVNLAVYKDYLQFVKQPMDLTTSETKLEQEQYASPRDFIVDLRHIFENARLYNTRDSEIYKMAKELESYFELCTPEFLQACQRSGYRTRGSMTRSVQNTASTKHESFSDDSDASDGCRAKFSMSLRSRGGRKRKVAPESSASDEEGRRRVTRAQSKRRKMSSGSDYDQSPPMLGIVTRRGRVIKPPPHLNSSRAQS